MTKCWGGIVGRRGDRVGVKFGDGECLVGVLLPASVRESGLLWERGEFDTVMSRNGDKVRASISTIVSETL